MSGSPHLCLATANRRPVAADGGENLQLLLDLGRREEVLVARRWGGGAVGRWGGSV